MAIQLLQISTEELTNLIKEGIVPELENALQKYLKELPKKDEYLSRKDTADYFGVSLPTIHDWIRKGIITPYKMGNRTYFNKLELIAKLKSSNSDEK
ncbi:helix-turn-helix domain-containing protein [Crocinitomicaceae bacterium]|nr:helix-turn-helix domain-containing protein [Crocinitomicaceae bacterium]